MQTNEVDSAHERYFEWWAEEAINKGLIADVRRADSYLIVPKQTIPFTKIGKTKEVNSEKFLFHPHTYCPDYVIEWAKPSALHDDMWNLDSNSKGFFWSMIDPIKNSNAAFSVIDIKPDMSGRSTSYTKVTFPINQKLVWYLHNTYVQKVVLFPASNSAKKNKTLFTETWTPERLIKDADWIYKKDCKTGKKGESKIKWPVKTIKNWL